MDKMAMESMTVQLPSSDIKLLKELSKKMGWITNKSGKKRNNSLDLAIKDIEEGRVKSFNSVQEMMDYLEK